MATFEPAATFSMTFAAMRNLRERDLDWVLGDTSREENCGPNRLLHPASKGCTASCYGTLDTKTTSTQ